MYKLLHEGEPLGGTVFESCDPDVQSVSGRFNNMGGAKALSSWLQANGGTEDDGVVYLVLNEDCKLQGPEGQWVGFDEATLIAIPESDEAYLELQLHDINAYQQFLEAHTALLTS